VETVEGWTSRTKDTPGDRPSVRFRFSDPLMMVVQVILVLLLTGQQHILCYFFYIALSLGLWSYYVGRCTNSF
jgi:hypothetical protein